MAHFALCPRDNITPSTPAPSNTGMRPRQKQPNVEDTLTWQQQENLSTQKVGESDAQRSTACFTSGRIPL
jgi:hypothetical protein